MTEHTEADYVIIGAGTAGLVVAQRLSKRLPHAKILVIEAGDDPSDNDTVKTFAGMNAARATKQNWGYPANLGPGLNNREEMTAAGKGIGGSSLINAGVWLRGSTGEWNHWAKVVDDNAWSYEAMLPYFRMTENFQGQHASDQHGYEGYLKVFPLKFSRRKYPLREKVMEAWKEHGEVYNPDPNDGSGNGLVEETDLWIEGSRQLPGNFLDLRNVSIMTEALVNKVIFENRDGKTIAVGVDLANGKRIGARKEVIISAGAYQSPKTLELSGIGDGLLLKEFGIEVIVDNPEVGRNLADHFLTTLTWKLKHPELGLALGSPAISDPTFFHAFPLDFIQHGPINETNKLRSLVSNEEERDNLLRPDVCHVQQWIIYLSFPKPLSGADVPLDGTYISTCTGLVSPLSRGTVHIKSSHPKDSPAINKQILSTTADEFVFASGLRRISEVMLNTKAGQSFIAGEVVPDGFKAVTPETSDEDIVARVRQFAWSINHPMGSCAMGKVVDSHCKVKGVEGLRVVDASVLPITPGATIQAAVYAVAERAAEFIASEAQSGSV